MKGTRTNLPPQTTRFVGREREAVAIAELVGEARVVTLTGEPGIGKTRLAVHVGARMFGDYVDGVWFVELSAVRDPDNVPSVVATALGMTGDGRPVLEQIVDFLAHRTMLLILDNCEHVSAQVCRVVQAIAEHCPNVRIVGTSRTALGLSIERTYLVGALAIPSVDEATVSGLRTPFDALELFADRARSSNGRFVLSDENLADVVRICRYLEGVAVAIELTASHVKAADVKMIAANLRATFGVDAGPGAVHPAARSMNWALAQLAEHERRTLVRLAVFAGGWTLASATAIASEPFGNARSMDAILASLLDQSLVAADSSTPGRFRLVESIRDHLATLPTEAESSMTAARHARFFADFVAEADRRHYEFPMRAVIGELLPEFENIRAAISWALRERNDLELGCAMVGALGYVWRIVSYHEGDRLVALALAVAAETGSRVSDLTRARLFRAAAELEIRLNPEVLELAQRSIEIYESLGLDVMAAESRRLYGFLLHRHHRLDEAIVELSAAAVTFALHGERRSEARALSDLSVPVWMTGQSAYAMSLHERAVDWATSISDRREASRMGLNFAECQFHSGEVGAAIRTASEAFARCEGADLQEILASNLAAYFLVQRNVVEAKRYALVCLELCRKISAPVARPIQHLAGVAALMGPDHFARSLQLLGFVNHQLQAMKERRDRTEQLTYDLTMEIVCSGVGPGDCETSMAPGAMMTHGEAIDLATSL